MRSSFPRLLGARFLFSDSTGPERCPPTFERIREEEPVSWSPESPDEPFFSEAPMRLSYVFLLATCTFVGGAVMATLGGVVVVALRPVDFPAPNADGYSAAGCGGRRSRRSRLSPARPPVTVLVATGKWTQWSTVRAPQEQFEKREVPRQQGAAQLHLARQRRHPEGPTPSLHHRRRHHPHRGSPAQERSHGD